MSDNVVKFRRIEKKPEEPKGPKKEPGVPDWLPWIVLVAVAVVLYGLQQAQIV
ncbi:hypothetical protein [Devosia limi]|uniref:Uncharacterized protein n=1 Tax=Devosia limi DSM 17137 TaxID=1121477 RepID=A0A1M4TBV1_9HYPH|nr:hypothetical protein [Devosia limi]SHE41865.1 hypothetical protein SAMN02745223_00328 [Devosia limi DSM 17137]